MSIVPRGVATAREAVLVEDPKIPLITLACGNKGQHPSRRIDVAKGTLLRSRDVV